MFKTPTFCQNVSLRLVSVLEDIGVNKSVVSRRRKSWLLKEALMTLGRKLWLVPTVTSINIFGSQVEGTTTLGLNSDADILYCYGVYNLIQDWQDWERDCSNIMMIQDENTPPGYCLLQRLNYNVPLPASDIICDDDARYREHMIVLKNTHFDKQLKESVGKNGAANMLQAKGVLDNDIVYAIPFKRLPEQVMLWLNQQLLQGKISDEIKRYIEHSKCYVVPVGLKGSQYEKAEWRISTSHAERCLMLNLNITQIQCYVMMKMLRITYLKHPEEKSLSTYMCKNVLLLCIRQTKTTLWSPQNILRMLTFYLIQVRKCVEREYCPHIIIHQNNLMAGRFTPNVKRWLLCRLQSVIESNGLAFLRVEMDEFGRRYNAKLTSLNDIPIGSRTQAEMTMFISGQLAYDVLAQVSSQFADISINSIESILTIIRFLTTVYQHGGELERNVSRLLTPFFCSRLGSIGASASLSSSNTVSKESMAWLMAGLHSDCSSGKLKLASIFYASGDHYIITLLVLTILDVQYDVNMVEAVCGCINKGFDMSPDFQLFSVNKQNETLKHITAFCVRFLPSEIHCVPRELKFEMFRSTADDLQYRASYDFWMDWAVVDSLPYMYFLQYKTHGYLQNRLEQIIALNRLISSIKTIKNVGHRETSLNLLGQCMEQENRLIIAYQLYIESLKIRPRNNAANFHLCLLLYKLYKRK